MFICASLFKGYLLRADPFFLEEIHFGKAYSSREANIKSQKFWAWLFKASLA